MCKGKFLWLCIVVTLPISSVGFAQDRTRYPRARQRGDDRASQDNRRQQTNRDPGARQRGDDAGGRLGIYLRRRLENLLPQLGETVGRRCGLDDAAVDSLRASTFDSANTIQMLTELFDHFFRTDRTVLSPWQTKRFEEFSTGLERGGWGNQRGR